MSRVEPPFQDALFFPSSCPCANNNSTTGTLCPRVGTKACASCFLVLYCSKECQAAHWKHHKAQCKSEMMKTTWRPSWETEQRKPRFVSDETVSFLQDCTKKFLWGNVPALDILQLKDNEGASYDKDIRLLFAASGDLRHVAKTIVNIPANFSKSVFAILNDKEFDIVARNVILLLSAMYIEPASAAAAVMLHTWYSALIPSSALQSLRATVLPLIREVCEKIANKPEDSLLSKTFTRGACSLRIVLKKSMWDELPAYLNIPDGLKTERARQVRLAATMSQKRKDYLERMLFCQLPGWRIAMVRFREDGILLPFGASKTAFDTPNPTVFQEPDVWPLKDNSDPLAGWSLEDVFKKIPSVKNDLYGGMYLCVRELLVAFCTQIKTLKVNLTLLHMDAADLPKTLACNFEMTKSFDRIESANIADRGYAGLKCLGVFAPLLRPVAENPHATLVTLFMNAHYETITEVDGLETMMREMRRVVLLLPPANQSAASANGTKGTNADAIRRIAACDLFHDFDGIFARYMRNCGFDAVAQAAGLRQKSKHTIVKPWPMRLESNASKTEFERLLGSNHSGSERYVEWQRGE